MQEVNGMKALFIGGTGRISTHAARVLLEKGWDVFVLNRGSTAPPEGAKSLVADINDEAAVKALLHGQYFDVVADFIAYTPQDVQRDIQLFEGITGQYIFISSASAYQKPQSNVWVTESTPLSNPYWQYSRDKIACEEVLMQRYRQTGFPITIVRPSHTYDEYAVPVAVRGKAGSWQVLKRMLDGKPVIVHGDGSSLWALTHSRDFARAFAGLAANPHTIGQAVHITTDECITWNQVYSSLSQALGVRLNVCYVPSVQLAAAGEGYGYNFGGELLGDKANSMLFDNSKIKSLVPGWCAETRFDEGVRESVKNIIANPALQKEDPQFDEFCDKMCAVVHNAFVEASVSGAAVL